MKGFRTPTWFHTKKRMKEKQLKAHSAKLKIKKGI